MVPTNERWNFFHVCQPPADIGKKIRILSKLQQQMVSAASSLRPDSVLLPISSSSNENHTWLVEELQGTTSDELSASDTNVSFFIAGYIGRSVSKL